MNDHTIYLDHAATTPVDPRVVESMLPYFTSHFGNASSIHELGREANVAVEEARQKVAAAIGAEPKEIVFTSGGTESNNAALRGSVEATGKRRVVTSNAEHHAVLHTAEHLSQTGAELTILPVGTDARITPTQLSEAIDEDTAIVSLMYVNNEVGAINPISQLADVCHEYGVLFHSDTVQALGKIPVNVDDLGVDFLSMSAHKFYGPKGVGALYIRNGTNWKPWMIGGSQERKRRGGTLNVPGIVGLARALELAVDEMEQNTKHILHLQQQLYRGIAEKFPGLIHLNSDPINGMYNIVNISIDAGPDRTIDGEMLLLNLDIEGIACSNGSACSSGAVEPSHVLKAIRLNPKIAGASLRFSLGKNNTEDDITYTLDRLEAILDRMLKTT